MGMIWNSAATQQMIATLLLEFSGDKTLPGATGDSPPILRWQGLSDYFDLNNSGTNYHLWNIAAAQGLYGGGMQGSTHDDNWKAWLKLLGDSNKKGSKHETLRGLIHEGLTSTTPVYSEIVFSVIPRTKNGAIKISDAGDATNDDGTIAKVIQIETPTVKAAASRLRELRRRRRERDR